MSVQFSSWLPCWHRYGCVMSASQGSAIPQDSSWSISSSIPGNSGISCWHCSLFPRCAQPSGACSVCSESEMSARAGLITERTLLSFPILSTWRDAAAGTAGEKKLEGNTRFLLGKKKKKGQEAEVGLP